MLLFAGDQDYICNYVGQEDTIEALEWGGARGLGVSECDCLRRLKESLILSKDAERLDYTVNGEPAGVWTSARNLTYVKVCATRLPQITDTHLFAAHQLYGGYDFQ